MNNILAKILDQKAIEIAALDRLALRRAAESSLAPRDFLTALKPFSPAGHPRLIAELKRASPSKGLLAPHLDLFEVAQIYATGGAAAISVLTDEKFFLGKLETMRELRFKHGLALPLLRKDFIIDESQIYEARANGADAILLIVAALPDFSHLCALHTCARVLNLTVLVEVHDEQEAQIAQNIPGLQLIGINNRNLVTFDVTLATTERVRPIITPGITVVSESGIFNAKDVSRMATANIDAILVGEALVTSGDIAAKVREISGVEVSS